MKDCKKTGLSRKGKTALWSGEVSGLVRIPGQACRLAMGLVLLAVLFACLASCRDPSDWYPRGRVELAGYYEQELDGTKTLYATVLVSNTGYSVINRSTLGISATTDQHRYYNTVVSELRILPDSGIWTTLAIPYASPDEFLLQDGLLVENGFYE